MDCVDLEADHPLKYLRTSERWEPRLTDRNSWGAWMAQTGGKDMRDRAREQAAKILQEHHPEYVTADQAKQIDEIVAEAQAYFVKTSDSGDVM